MKIIKESYKCDICGKEVESAFRINYPVIFTTEQQEGMSCKPYIEQTNLDLCNQCMEKVAKIKAVGAMGNNQYKIMEADNEQV